MSLRYLKLAATLADDGQIALRLDGLTEAPPARLEDPSSPVVADVFNANGQLIFRRRIAVDQACLFPRLGHQLTIADRIAVRDDAARIVLTRDGVFLQEVAIGRVPPDVRLRWRPDGEMRGTQTIRWEASHPERRPIHFVVRYTADGGRRWQPVSFRTHDNEAAVDFDALPGGERCRIAIVASDGINPASVESVDFRVPVKPCRVLITAPADAATYRAGQLVTLRGQGFYLEDRRIETSALRWSSSRDGNIGRRMVVDTSQLSAGDHVITLIAGDEGREGQASITLRVVPERGGADAPI